MPVWRELQQLKLSNLEVASLQMLPDVLKLIPAPDNSANSMKDYVESLTDSVPWRPDGFTVWKALSGIFASNASGRVYFSIGSGVTKDNKVFAATEIFVLLRNQNIDPLTKEIVSYLHWCVQIKRADINFGFLPS